MSGWGTEDAAGGASACWNDSTGNGDLTWGVGGGPIAAAGDWNGVAAANDFTSQDARSGENSFGASHGGFNETSGGVEGDGACRNCGQEGHFARDCPEPRKNMGACFNCGEEGHSKADCAKPRKFTGECRLCNLPGHPAAECPDRKIMCKNCLQEGHEALGCENPKIIDLSRVPDKTVSEAWAMLKVASDEREIGEFKEAVQILSKAMPELTYPQLEKECRTRKFNVHVVAMEKEHGDTYTVVNMQGEIEKKYCVFFFLSDKPQRPAMKERWPESAADNMERLADAGIAVDRGIPKCNNCDKLGHQSRACPEEKVTIERATIVCALCGEEGHRVRDCTQERQKPREPRACKICESIEHVAKDCPDRQTPTCRNCGSEDHMAKECDQPRNPATIQCRNCDQMGHPAKECKAPKDWSRVKCSNCEQMGHTKVRCKESIKEDSGFGGAENSGSGSGDGFAAVNNAFGSGDIGASAGASDWNQSGGGFEPAPAVSTGGW